MAAAYEALHLKSRKVYFHFATHSFIQQVLVELLAGTEVPVKENNTG